MARRACVVHNSLNSMGGGERVALAVIEALRELGYRVTLVTTEPTDWGRVDRLLGRRAPRPDEERAVLPFRLRAFGLYARLLTSLRILLEGARCGVTVNTHGDLLPVPSDIIYMHFPTFALLRETPDAAKYRRGFWRLYFKPYELIQGLLARRVRAGVILTNSVFSREAIRRYLGVDARVVYPPVDLGPFLGLPLDGREPLVAACGRFTPEKRFEDVVEIAARTPELRYAVIGARSGTASGPYIARLKRLIRSLRLSNIELHVDAPRSLQLAIYSRASAFIHAMHGEHFGIAVVEAMAAGLVPVVHRSGGAWRDVTARGRYGLSYETLEEAVGAVREAVARHAELAPLAREASRRFTWERFKEEFKAIVEEVAGP